MTDAGEAVKNLREHGIEVDLPNDITEHASVRSSSEIMQGQDGLESAVYSPLDGRIDVFTPVAIYRAIGGLDQEDFELLNDEVKSQWDDLERGARDMLSSVDEDSLLYDVKYSKLYFIAAGKGDLPENVEEKIYRSLDEELLDDLEHELVHTSHYQQFLESDNESLEGSFRKYVEEVEGLSGEVDDFDRITTDPVIFDEEDLKMSLSVKSLNEDKFELLVDLAEREKEKWSKRYDELLGRDIDKQNDVQSKLDVDLGFPEVKLFDQLLEQINGSIGRGADLDEVLIDIRDSVKYQRLQEKGVEESNLDEALVEYAEFYRSHKSSIENAWNNMSRVKSLLEDSIEREAKLQNDEFEDSFSEYSHRLRKIKEFPSEFTEAFAQFWTAYRRGDLEDNRQEVYDRLEGYGIEGLDETMDDIFQMYDEAQGDQKEKVTEVMSSQMDYLEENYDLHTE